MDLETGRVRPQQPSSHPTGQVTLSEKKIPLKTITGTGIWAQSALGVQTTPTPTVHAISASISSGSPLLASRASESAP